MTCLSQKHSHVLSWAQWKTWNLLQFNIYFNFSKHRDSEADPTRSACAIQLCLRCWDAEEDEGCNPHFSQHVARLQQCSYSHTCHTLRTQQRAHPINSQQPFSHRLNTEFNNAYEWSICSHSPFL